MNTKERILAYLEFKGISKKEFLDRTGVKRGLLDSDKLSASVKDNVLERIISTYPDLNILWLLTGNGEMTTGRDSRFTEIETGKDLDFIHRQMEVLSQLDTMSRRILESQEKLILSNEAVRQSNENLTEAIAELNKQSVKTEQWMAYPTAADSRPSLASDRKEELPETK